LKARYDGLMSDWERRREQAQLQLQQELATQKTAGLDVIRRELGDERERSAARTAAAAALHEAELTRLAAEKAYRHVSAMLERLAGPALTARIVEVVLEDLADLPGPERDKLAGAAAPAGSDAAAAAVATAHVLDDATRRRLAQGLAGVTQGTAAPAFTVQPELIAGVRITLGQWMLKADLADELAYFMERDQHA
jgi:F-type H+-transporting ATPase subunit b